MQVVMFKKKKYILLLLITLVLAAVTAGIYLFVNPKINGYTTYTVDKYSDVTNWCDTSVKDEKLTVDCKALLTNIDLNSCFEAQVITKDKELKDLTVCEKDDTLSYTNDILGYKKLMPIDIVFTYTKEGILGNYSFSNVSFAKVDDTYIQGIVNKDIEEIVGLDRSSTTILNSFDFCPTPMMLPDYIVEKQQYAKYWEENTLSEEEYRNGYNYNLDDTTIRLLFACDSAKNIGYTNVCANNTAANNSLFDTNLLNLNTIPNWDKDIANNDDMFLKEISLIYDNLYLKEAYVTLSDEMAFNKLIERINNSHISEMTFCSIYKIYESMGNENGLNYVKNTVLSNISKISTPSCTKIYKNMTDLEGRYLQTYFSSSSQKFKIMNRCQNLTLLIK